MRLAMLLTAAALNIGGAALIWYAAGWQCALGVLLWTWGCNCTAQLDLERRLRRGRV